MLSKITKKITNEILITVPGITEEKAEEIDYGLYMAFSDGLKLIAVLLTAFALGQLRYALVAVAVFSVNKSYFGGIHAKTQLGCIITHFTFIFGTIYLSHIIAFNYLNIILFIISGVLVYLYAPADLISKPIITEKRRKELRIKSSVVFIICFIISFFVPKDFSNVMSIITLINAVNLTPVVYKITKNRKGGVLNEKR
ncbi:accessory gene regulator ArgB-like protein [Ruminiclostridium cellobioparum]|jgi:accessory gene regulator B|uniref:Accessory gene regulator B protein n=1 Tax=Ruminiclostridium cellobioparum subsp. termitidis CT1112 TaxID=1195236 RepID=S0FUG6_RUMCE|nr:accessory gene regulator AgrB [Ruminiclostridium cellobioparum]EMS72173.1 accessory gene regulator B protein [Ruminiclostridium cellobioparum subsp. termitidis CT1112]